MCGATPVLCEVDPETFCMNVESVVDVSQLNSNYAVHLYGQSADMTSLCAFAKARNIKVIEMQHRELV